MKKLLILLSVLLCLSFAAPTQTASDKEQIAAVDLALKNASINTKQTVTVNVADYSEALRLVVLLAKKGEINKGRFTCHNKPFLFTDAGSENSRIEYTPAGQKPTIIVWFQAQ